MDEKETYQWAMRTVVKFFKTLLGKYVFKGISNQYKEAVIYVCVQLLLDNRKVLNDLPKEDQQILLRAIKIIQEKNNPKCK
ncbi:Uncharacterised protein [Actinobacillus delphinicola]|uniref:Uncharacterized protein n=2 Tax=Actinobacillus delphinicola TaxID=51161 RepID=A0A448TUX0_9PAST|nr:Uncharacterised protein [Actinobacillus delphinicola]